MRAIRVPSALTAVIGAVAGVVITSPALDRILLTHEGVLYGRKVGQSGYDLLLGEYHDVSGALLKVATEAGLNESEVADVMAAFASIIDAEAELQVTLARCDNRARFTEIP